MHTPDQARELWCPMVRIARHEVTEQRQLVNAESGMELVNEQHHIVGGVNHDALSGNNKRMAADHQPLASCRCIADKCGMWRWVPVTTTHGELRIEKKQVALVPFGSEMRSFEVTVQVPDAPTHGYCGLAGRPV